MFEWINISVLRAYVSSFSRNEEMPQEQEHICRFCKKLLNSPIIKHKELLVAAGQQSVVLAAEVERLGQCLHRGENDSQLSCLSCAQKVVRLAHSCATINSRCNEHLEKLEDSPVWTTPPSSKRSSALRSPTGETLSAKRNKDEK